MRRFSGVLGAILPMLFAAGVHAGIFAAPVESGSSAPVERNSPTPVEKWDPAKGRRICGRTNSSLNAYTLLKA